MSSHIEKIKAEVIVPLVEKEVYFLCFKNEEANISQKIVYNHIPSKQNLNKAFDILFETLLKRETGKGVDNAKDHDMVSL